VLHAAAQAGVVCLVLAVTFAMHEGGHILAARLHHLVVHAVVVRGLLEGATQRQVSPSWRVNAIISLAGPLASMALGGLGMAVALTTPDPYWAGRALAVVNLFVVLSTLTSGSRSDGVRAWRAWRGRPTGADRLGQSLVPDHAGRVDPVPSADLHQN
jgi:hypothetical protein